MRNYLLIIALAAAATLASPAGAEDDQLAFLGVSSAPVHPSLAAQLELAEGAGLAVAGVVDDGPAAKAGIREHDILAALDGIALTSPRQLRELVLTRKPGDEVELTLIRRAKEESIKVALGALPEDLAEPGVGERGGLGFPGGALKFGVGPDGIIAPGDIDKVLEDMMKKMDPDGVRDFPRFPKGALPGGGFPGGAAGGVTSHSSVSIDDGAHKIEMETRDGISTVKAYDASGKLLYDGPYNTEEEKAAAPEEVRKKLDNIKSDIRVLPFPDLPGKVKPPVPSKKRTI